MILKLLILHNVAKLTVLEFFFTKICSIKEKEIPLNSKLNTLTLTTDLLQVDSQSKLWIGSIADNRMVETKTRLKNGLVRFTFIVRYTNGIEKLDEIYIEIIGSVYDPLNYHRSN